MKNKEKKLIFIILSLLVLIILIGFLIKKIKTNYDIDNATLINEKEDLGEEDGIGFMTDKKFRKLDNEYNIYFTVKNILNTYIAYFEKINGDVAFDIGRIQMSSDEIKKTFREEGLTAVKSLFDFQYDEKTKTNEQLIIEQIKKYKNVNGNLEYTKKIDEIYMCNIDENNLLLLIYTKINNVPFNCMLKLDVENERYSIFWEDFMKKNNYTKDREDETTIDKNIEKNNYNYCMIVSATSEYIVVQYFQDLKDKMLNNPQELYNMLDESYKNKRFSTYNTFAKRLNDIKDIINKSYLTKFKFEENKIKIIDNYNNMYSFLTSGVMQYKVLLDDYTIEDSEIAKNYNNLSDGNKVNTNIEKFFRMINLKDYESAYNLLDNDFKKKNYPSLEAFKKYVEKNLFNYSKVTNISNSDKSGNYYITSLDIINGEKEAIEAKQITVIMQLLEGTGFVMSFSMN